MKLPSGYTLHTHDMLDSTSAEARRLAAEAAGSTVVWAKAQTAGRGRYDRGWISDKGNLFATFLLFPDTPAERLPELSFVAALAAGEAVGKAEFKWPNDILLNGRKTGGILLESGQEGGRRFALAGIGINVASHPEGVMYPATSLQGENINITVEKLLERLVSAFDTWYKIWQQKGFASVRTAWLEFACGVEEEMEVRLPQETLRGVMQGLSADGALELRLPDGKIKAVTAGDVFLM